MAKKAGQLDYSKEGAAYAYINKGEELGQKGNFTMQHDPRTGTVWAGMTASQFADAPFGTEAKGAHPGKDYIEAVGAQVGWMQADNGMEYATGAASLKTTPEGALPDPENMSKQHPFAQPKTAAKAQEIFETMVATYNEKVGAVEKVAEKEAEAQAEAPVKETVGARKQFTGREFDVRKDTPGYDALKTATHEPTEKAEFLVKVYESGHTTVVNNPRGNEPGGYVNDVAGLADAIQAAGVKPIELSDGAKGYDVKAFVEFGDKGLKLDAASIEQREGGIEKPLGFERRFEDAKAQASANAEEYAAEKGAAEKEAGAELGA